MKEFLTETSMPMTQMAESIRTCIDLIHLIHHMFYMFYAWLIKVCWIVPNAKELPRGSSNGWPGISGVHESLVFAAK
jgi:hypothetical protein